MGELNMKRCIRLATASDKVYQLLAQGRWFSRLPTPLKLVTIKGFYSQMFYVLIL